MSAYIHHISTGTPAYTYAQSYIRVGDGVKVHASVTLTQN